MGKDRVCNLERHFRTFLHHYFLNHDICPLQVLLHERVVHGGPALGALGKEQRPVAYFLVRRHIYHYLFPGFGGARRSLLPT